MKTQLITLTSIVCLALCACDKRKVVPYTSPDLKFVSKIAKVVTGTTDTAFTYISYDSKNRISEIKTTNNIRTYNYTGDDLTSVTNKDTNGVAGALITFTYNNGVVAGAHSPSSSPWLDYTYTYNVANGRVTKRNGPNQYTHEFTYTGNNLAAVKMTSNGATGYYEYGLDKSPFYNSRYRYNMTVAMESDDIFSENNLITYTARISPFLGSRYSYLMGNDGFPKSAHVKATRGFDSDSFIYYDITYTYELREPVK